MYPAPLPPTNEEIIKRENSRGNELIKRKMDKEAMKGKEREVNEKEEAEATMKEEAEATMKEEIGVVKKEETEVAKKEETEVVKKEETEVVKKEETEALKNEDTETTKKEETNKTEKTKAKERENDEFDDLYYLNLPNPPTGTNSTQQTTSRPIKQRMSERDVPVKIKGRSNKDPEEEDRLKKRRLLG